LQLLADEMVALEVVDSICPETVRQTLKKQDDKAEYRVLGDPAGAGRGIYCVYRRGARNLAACPGRGLLAWPLGLENSKLSNARHIDHVCE
jgi:hypothetical protein